MLQVNKARIDPACAINPFRLRRGKNNKLEEKVNCFNLKHGANCGSQHTLMVHANAFKTMWPRAIPACAMYRSSLHQGEELIIHQKKRISYGRKVTTFTNSPHGLVVPSLVLKDRPCVEDF